MGIKETWNEQSSGVKAAILIVGGLAVLFVLAIVAVILFAVIGSFVLGTGGTSTTAPQMSADCTVDDSAIIITHSGGDAINVDELVIEEVPPEQVTMPANTFSAGDEIRVEGVNEVTLLWMPDNAETTVLVSCQG